VDTLYTPETLENFYNYQYKDQNLQRRNQVIISLLIYQGLTASEICNLQIDDINLDKAEVTIRSNQNQNRILPLQAKQIVLFLNYLQED
jgi:integrase